MHMGSELMSVPVAAGMLVAAGGGIAYASAKARAHLDERRVPLLGVLGAFVFAAQMVNFPVMPGTSGQQQVCPKVVDPPHRPEVQQTARRRRRN